MNREARQAATKLYYLKKWKLFDTGVGARLPEVYKNFYKDWLQKPPTPVHFIPQPGRYHRNKNGEVKPVQNVPLPTKFPLELTKALLGGEKVVQGFTRKPKRRRVPKFWIPYLKRSVVYSEVLNKYMNVIVTPRALDLIHENAGLDYYLLKTEACDLRSEMALKIKRNILLALRDKELPYDETKNQFIYDKYKQFLLPDDEIEWYGLTYHEACKKLQNKEKEERVITPLKQVYRLELIKELREAGVKEAQALPTESTGWLSKIKNPFSTDRKS